MSKKHEKRTRAEILAKRAEMDGPIVGRIAFYQMPHKHLSKYMTHFGAKQQAKLQRTALKLAA
jgi:hypothetical protein